jgi:hypothetical protein
MGAIIQHPTPTEEVEGYKRYVRLLRLGILSIPSGSKPVFITTLYRLDVSQKPQTARGFICLTNMAEQEEDIAHQPKPSIGTRKQYIVRNISMPRIQQNATSTGCFPQCIAVFVLV